MYIINQKVYVNLRRHVSAAMQLSSGRNRTQSRYNKCALYGIPYRLQNMLK